ncbi:hypothetical protein D3C72_1184190 [compost metagenome]
MKALRNIDSILPCHRVDNQQHFIRLGDFMNLTKLFHQLLVHVQTACRINNQIIVAVILGMLKRLTGNLNRINTITKCKHRNPNLLTEHLKLFDRGRSVNVPCYKQRPVILLQKKLGQLGGGGRLTRTLETRHHNYGWRLITLSQLRLAAAHKFC